METTGLIALQIVILSIMIVGLFSLLTLVIPGLVIIWVGALIYALVTGLNWASGIAFGLISVLMIAGNIIDNVMMGAGARKQGASWISITVALVAALVGTLVWPPFGGLLVALAGIFIVEMIRLKEFKKAWESVKGLAGGCGWAFVIRFSIGVMMIGLWLVWAFLLPLWMG